LLLPRRLYNRPLRNRSFDVVKLDCDVVQANGVGNIEKLLIYKPNAVGRRRHVLELNAATFGDRYLDLIAQRLVARKQVFGEAKELGVPGLAD
jgi:hypothetical protein